MDDEPMWAVDRVVALAPGFAITIPDTANKFTIKGNHLTLIKGNQFNGRIKTDSNKHVHEFLGLDELNKATVETWDELRTAFNRRFFPSALFASLLEEI
uniref:Reverse transcriptase domain-containing protein n=1 Tax=Tanacetum cinerariifolium TaxID=118510 RepID=A0A6L2K6X4_TANCI|nr:reverse transcriptase domain-containing protein [Tanacetum cinerariifolium]